MATILNLQRETYVSIGQDKLRPSLDYLSAKYKNIRQLLSPRDSYQISVADQANAPGLAFKFYGDKGYWWVICLYNGILDPIMGFEPGMVIQLPSLADINAMLTSQDQLKLANNLVII